MSGENRGSDGVRAPHCPHHWQRHPEQGCPDDHPEESLGVCVCLCVCVCVPELEGKVRSVLHV